MNYEYTLNKDNFVLSLVSTNKHVDNITIFSGAISDELVDDYSQPLYLIEKGKFKKLLKEPTKEQLNAKIAQKRRDNYLSETDPLFFKFQRKQTEESKQIWLNSIQSIKKKHPYIL